MIQTTAAQTEGQPFFGLGDVIVVPESFTLLRRPPAPSQYPDVAAEDQEVSDGP